MTLSELGVLVPQGAEYRAVCRGLRSLPAPPPVYPVAMGPEPVTRSLKALQAAGALAQHDALILLGLAGALRSELRVGDRVLYDGCQATFAPTQLLTCDAALTAGLAQRLMSPPQRGLGLTTTQMIHQVSAKQQLAEDCGAIAVDMEGFAALQWLTEQGVPVAMLRVISDTWDHNLPDLAGCVDATGKLRPLPLGWAFLRQPIAASHLIRGSLQGLAVLTRTTRELFAPQETAT